jgi:hypothetical protein
MRPYDDPACLCPDEQLRQLARIFAIGLLRLRRPLPAAMGSQPGPKNSPKSSPNCLELFDEQRLSGQTG